MGGEERLAARNEDGVVLSDVFIVIGVGVGVGVGVDERGGIANLEVVPVNGLVLG